MGLHPPDSFVVLFAVAAIKGGALKFFHILSRCGIIIRMKKTFLLTTNNYLKDRRQRDKLLRRTVLTSSAVEGVGKAAVVGLTKGSTFISTALAEVSDVKQQ